VLRQTIIGVINLSFPIIVACQFYPALLTSVWGRLICCLLLGSYVYYLNKKTADTMVTSFRFTPSAAWKDELSTLVSDCGVDPHTITINYAYTAENTAMAVYRTLVLDPVVASTIAEDPEAQKVMDIFQKFVEPGLSPLQKTRLAETKQFFTPAAQRFVFRHELGHVVYNFSQKKLGVIFLIGASSAWCALSIAALVVSVNGIAAIVAGMVVGGVADLVFTYTSNFFFKIHEEKKADLFAAQYSSPEEIEAAALFFEKHAELQEQHGDKNFLAKLPSAWRSGHPEGRDRAAYLRGLLSK